MKRWIWRSLIVVVLLLLVGLGAGLYFLGTIIKKGVESAGPNITKTTVKLDSATLSIFSGNGELKGFFVGNPEGFKSPSAVRAGSVAVGVQPRSVFSDKVIVRSVKVIAPEITFDGTLAGNNLSKILANIRGTEQKDKQATTKKEQSSSKKLQLDDFIITGGKINLTTSLLGGQSATLILPEIHLTNLGQGSDGITAAELSERVFRVIVEETIKQVSQSSIGKNLSEFTKKIPGGATQEVDRVTRNLGDLLKKNK
jgi:uncharacterized protein involved in outer membrane biogenesis